MKDSHSSLYRAMSRFLSGTMLSRFSGLARDIVMAYAFGTNAAVAAFLVSFRFAHLLRRVLGEGCLQTAFIPLFEELKMDDPKKAHYFFRSLQRKLALVLIGVVLVTMGLLGGVLGLADLSSGNRSIVLYTLVMMPSLIFICLYGLSSSLLQCEGSFFLTSIAPVAFNGAWLVGALLLSFFPADQALFYLGFFLIGGSFLQWAWLLPKQKRLLGEVFYSDPGMSVKKILKPMSLGIIGIAATQVNGALDAIFARISSLEGPAYLWYAIRIEQLPLALFGVALSGALLPPLTRAVKAGNIEKARSFFKSAISATIVTMIPMTCALFISGNVSVALLYERGDFDAVSLENTVLCLWGYGLGLLPSVIILVTAPLYFASSDYKTPSKVACQSVALSIVLNLVGTMLLGFGPFWIAVTTSMAAFFNAGMLLWRLPSVINFSVNGYGNVLVRSVACSCLYAMSVYFFVPENFGGHFGSFMLHLGAFGVAVGPLWYTEFRPQMQEKMI